MALEATGLVLAVVGLVALVASLKSILRSLDRWSVVVIIPVVGASLANIVFSAGHAVMAAGLATSLILALAPRRHSRRTVRAPASVRPHFIALGLVAWLGVRELSTAPLRSEAVAGLVASAGFLLLCILVSRGGGVRRGDLMSLMLGYLSFGMVYSAVVGSAWAPCQPGKCTPVGQLYRAGLPTENTAALLAGMVLLLALGKPAESRWLAILTSGLVLYVSGGRTGLLAVTGACVLALVIAWVAPHDETRGGVRPRKLFAYGLSGVLAVGALWVAVHSTTTNFSSRGRIWRAAVELVPVGSLGGRRISDWELLRSESILPDHSAHSLYVHVFFGGGLIALGLVVAFFGALVSGREASDRRSLWSSITPIMFVMIAGLTEVVWNPATIDSLAILLLPLLVLRPWVRHSAVPVATLPPPGVP